MTTLVCHDCGHPWNADHDVSPGEPATCAECWASDTELVR